MLQINSVTSIDQKNHIAILDTSSVSFMQEVRSKGANADIILKDYDLILIPNWVLTEIKDSSISANYIQDLIDKGYPIYSIEEELYSQDRDTLEFQRSAEEQLRRVFASRTPVPISYKSNDAILCQLCRLGIISIDQIGEFRKNERKITYSRAQIDQSIVLVTEYVNNEDFVELVQDSSVHIIF